MATKIVRLHVFEEGNRIDVIERSEQRLARAARAGGRVFDVECDKAPWKACALRTLNMALQPDDPFAEDAGRRARARAAVVELELPKGGES